MSFQKTSYSLARLGAAAVLALVAACGGSTFSTTASHLVIWTNDSAVIANDDNLTFNVGAADDDGRLVPLYSGTWTFTTTDSGAKVPGAYTTKAADYGTKSGFAIKLAAAGNTTITVKDANGLTGSITVPVVALAPQMAVTIGPASATNFPGLTDLGTTKGKVNKYSAVATVEIQDQLGRDLPAATTKVSLALSATQSGVNPAAALPPLPTTYFEIATKTTPIPTATAFGSYTFTAGDAGLHVFGLQFPSTDATITLNVTDTATTGAVPAGQAVWGFTEKGAISGGSRLVVKPAASCVKLGSNGVVTDALSIWAVDNTNQLLTVSDPACTSKNRTDTTKCSCNDPKNTACHFLNTKWSTDTLDFAITPGTDVAGNFLTPADAPIEYAFSSDGTTEKDVVTGQVIQFNTTGTFTVKVSNNGGASEGAGISGTTKITVVTDLTTCP